MKYGVNLKIDVTKIDKNKLFKGQKGTYLDAQVFIEVDEQDQYGNNGMITQAAPKGEQGAILGNAKIFWQESGQQSGQNQAQQQPQGQYQAPQPQQASGQFYQQPPGGGGGNADFITDEVPF